jgi:hypothetical protein
LPITPAGDDPVKFFILLLVALLFMAPAIRLLSAASRTRQTPELWAALYFLGAGIGLPLRLYGSSILETQPDFASTINLFGHLFFASGVIAMTIFTWRVFHPERKRARAFAIALITLIVSTTCYTLSTGMGSAETSAEMIATNSARLVPTYWAFFESFKYWGAMRKRAALGLGDPIVTNRFLLWAIWTAAVSALPTASLGLRVLEMLVTASGTSVAVSELLEPVLLGLRILFLAVAPLAVIALSLSFFPPARYLEGIRARAADSSTA